MKTQLTTRYGTLVALSVILFCGSLWADGGSFLDDFSDGDIQDGSPVTWGWDDDAPAERLVTDEGLHLDDVAPYAVLRDEQGNDIIYSGNMTIRMQLRMNSYESWGNAGVYFRATRADCYKAGVVENQLFLVRKRDGAGTVLRQPTVPGFSPTEQDIIVEINATDFTDNAGQRTSRLEVYHWFPGQEKPAQPLISLVDGMFAQGGLALYVDGCSVTFRWVEVITHPVAPAVDFNGDGAVDLQDLLKMIRSWGRDERSADLHPDGVVGAADLEVLMGYWGQAVSDPTLIAHWALDETEGEVAYDSTGLSDAVLLGGPTWERDGGAIDGALRLDGQDDCLVVDSVLNPAEGPFSILAWVKGGAPGQTIVSQANGENWLCADPATGCLMTELIGIGRDLSPLCSEAIITDGDWHRVGLACDGANRTLYVDDILVAEEAQAGTPIECLGGLNIGCGQAMTGGSFFSGLIDEVRLYNRAIKP